MTAPLFSWQDILDIALVTVLIYSIISYIRGTRALAALKGLLALVGIYLIAQNIGLYSMVWIFENLFSSLLLIIVILFRDDIRQALSNLSIYSFVKKEHTPNGDLVKIISRSCTELSRRNLGAIIIFEMKMGLADLTSQAVELDAIPSYDLLVTLFTHQSALHDGAIILDGNGRIKAAGCILPLATVKRKHFGTRHRAAIGITEVSDAFVVVVSEERGEITFASGGTLSKPLTTEELERKLHEII